MPVRLIIAQSNFIMGEGLRSVFSEHPDFHWVGVVSDAESLRSVLLTEQPNAMLIDYLSPGFAPADVVQSLRLMPGLRVVGITNECETDVIQKLLESGLMGHLMGDCDRDEVIDSIVSTQRGEKFFCGKVLDQLNADEGNGAKHGCDPVTISERELEILQLIAQGLTTKQIADKLFLSFHTVMTHRKNMMNKLGINNTAGLIIYAVRENLISPNRFLFSQDDRITN